MSGFFYEFCKVEFLCYVGEPNWLGWLILIPFFLILSVLWVGGNLLLIFGSYNWSYKAFSEASKKDSTFITKIKVPFVFLASMYMFALCLFGLVFFVGFVSVFVVFMFIFSL